MDDTTQIVADAAEKVIVADEKFIPSIYRGLIPSDAPGKLAGEIATAVVAALTAAGKLGGGA